MSRIIVTGASGYIGRHVIRALTEMGLSVVAVSRKPSDSEFSDVEQINKDFRAFSLDEWKPIAAGATVVHLAWSDGFKHDSDAHMGELSDHFRFLSTLVDAGIERFVSIGSMHEVGSVEGEIDELVACNPVSQYGVAKNAFRLAAEEFCRRSSTSYTWLRCFYVVGDDERNHSVFTKILEREAAGDSEFSLTSGLARFDFIEVERLGRLIAAVSLEDFEGVLNLGSGNVRSLRDEVESFVDSRGLRIRPVFGAFPERQGISVGAWPKLDRLKSIERTGETWS